MISVSILMSVFNTPVEYLVESIESIINQTFEDYEFIIINDGSTDADVVSLLKEYEGKYEKVILINNKENLGLTRSLNIGIDKCQGKYIARMDSDDIAKPERIFKQYVYLENNPNVSVLGTDVEQIKQKGLHIAPFRNYMENEERFKIKMLFNNVGPVHPTVMIRRDFLLENNIRYREAVRKTQDYALWIDCVKAGGKFACLTDKLLLYRVHKGQITNHNSDEQQIFRKQLVCEQMIGYLNLCQSSAEILSTLYTEKYAYSVREYINALKEIRICNRTCKRYERNLFEREVRVRWLHKVFKCYHFGNDSKGFFCMFTFRCIFTMALIEWINDYLKM